MASDTKAAKKAAKKAGKGGGSDPEAAPTTVRRQKAGLLDRLTSLVVVLFLVTSAVDHVVRA